MNKHFTKRAHFIWLVMINMPFFTSEQPKRYKLWSCQKMCDALHYLLDNIFIRFDSKLFRQIVGIPMGTTCAPLGEDLFCFIMRETSCCLCQTIIKLILLKLLSPPPDIYVNNPYFEQMVGQIYPTELQLNKVNSSDTEAPFFGLELVHNKWHSFF